MTADDEFPMKRIFIASSQTDNTVVESAVKALGLACFTLEKAFTPGTTWVESLHRCLSDVDLVVGIIKDRRKESNVFFELGAASALNRPTILFVGPDYPIDLIPPSGIPYLIMDMQSEEGVIFGLRQGLSLLPTSRLQPHGEGFTTRPIGQFANHLLARLPQANAREFEDLVLEALTASGASSIARGSEIEDRGIDFAIWSGDLEPMIKNPLLIECKSNLKSQSEVNEVIGRMFRALDPISNGWGIVLYKETEAAKAVKAAPKSLPVSFVSAEDFFNGLRDIGLAEYVRKLRNTAIHG